MARPAKPIALQTAHNTAQDIQARTEAERLMRGNADNLKPPKYLSTDQKRIFNYIVKETQEADLYGNLDVYVLAQFCIVTDRLIELERLQNTGEVEKFSKDMISARKVYSSDFTKYGTELGLSPSARAKIGGIAAQSKKEAKNPILQVIGNE